jgi:hypothetical protein
MGPIDTFFHLLNFAAPALGVGVLTALFASLFMKNKPLAQHWYAQAAINFIVCLLVLLGGLWFFGRDGKMATYVVLVLASGSSQWLLSRH